MIAPNENGRPTEAGTPVADQRVSADAVSTESTLPRTTWEVTMLHGPEDFDRLLDRLRESEGSEVCERCGMLNAHVIGCINSVPLREGMQDFDTRRAYYDAGYFVDSTDGEPRDTEEDVS